MTGRRHTAWQTFRMPLFLAVTICVALITGLLADGTLDLAAVVALAVPVCWCLWKLAGGITRTPPPA